MKITNKAEGPRGFYSKDGTLVTILPGQTASVEGFNRDLPSHKAQVEAGEIVLGEADKAEAKAEPKKA
jgi:hypothetical protein